MTVQRIQPQEDIYFRVMRIFQATLTQRQIAYELGISTSGLNYCLKPLTSKGLLVVQNFNQIKNKTGYIYILTPYGIS